MRVLITGGAGMIGSKLASRLLSDGKLGGQPIDQIDLLDVVDATQMPSSSVSVETHTGDLRSTETVQRLIDRKPDVVFHLAAVVSGEAELDFDKGYGINLDGTRNLLDAIRHAEIHPRVVFASSIAVFGAPFPEMIPDDFFCTPLTSYGTQKAMCELLVSDYSRRGILDGISVRLPTICVRPGKPNAAASGFFSSIIREPLAGQEAVLPVSEDVLHWHASPRAAVAYLIHASQLDTQQLGARRAVTLPGLPVTVAQQIEALRSVAGQTVAARIRHQPDEFTQKIVAGWPRQFDASRALELGFQPDASFEDIIRYHIEDELDGKIA